MRMLRIVPPDDAQKAYKLINPQPLKWAAGNVVDYGAARAVWEAFAVLGDNPVWRALSRWGVAVPGWMYSRDYEAIELSVKTQMDDGKRAFERTRARLKIVERLRAEAQQEAANE